MAKQVSVNRRLSEENKRILLSLKHEEITSEWMKLHFANIDDTPPKIRFSDEFTLTVEDSRKLQIPTVSNSIETTAGRFICNFFMLGNAKFTRFFEYINIPWNKKVIHSIDKRIGILLLEEKISSEDVTDLIDRQQWIGFALSSWVNPSISRRLFKTNPEVAKQLDKDIADNKEKVDKADINVCIDITNRAEKKFTESIKDDPAYDWVASGASKNVLGPISVARGLVAESKNPSNLKFIRSSLQEGIEKDEIPDYADLGIGAACSRGIETQQGGYIVKQFLSAFSHVKLGEKGSDCNSRFTIDVLIDSKSLERYHLRYCYYNNKEYCLDEDTIKKLMGKTVKMRTPLYCKSEDICNKCAGEMYYRMGLKNVGLICSSVGSALLNASLKGFHESTIKSRIIDLDKESTRL